MRRTWCVALVAALGVATLFIWRSQSTADQNNPVAPLPGKPEATVLPLAQVVLFSSGVGYFQREGTIEGNARVDLTFPMGEVNDLLKSLVLLDMDPEKATTVGYDSQEPVERTLMSFALDLTGNPTLGQLLNQARGEKVEAALIQTATGQPAVLSGVIMSIEHVDCDVLNLLCSEGLRALPLNQIQRLRFLNAQLDSEFRRALEVLANTHNSQKRNISLTLAGEGKRPIKLGYVVENPIWKTSYRLIHDRDGKLRIQGWALIENTSEEDWRDVKLTLVSSRPISYQMDLYQPLYVPRPTVEPRTFATDEQLSRSINFQGFDDLKTTLQDALDHLSKRHGVTFVVNERAFKDEQIMDVLLAEIASPNPIPPMHDTALGTVLARILARIPSLSGATFLSRREVVEITTNNFVAAEKSRRTSEQIQRLTFEEMQNRRQQQEAARQIGSAVALDTLGGLPVVAGEKVGDYFRHDIKQRVTLPRLKSAMLSITNQPIEGERVSIFNERVHATAPLLGFKLKNTTGQHLMQGPITVFDRGAYAGDARLPDVQPNEVRLIAYGIDQGVEVVRETTVDSNRLLKAEIKKGVLFAVQRMRTTTHYRIENRAPGDRKVIVEQPLRPGWKIASEIKPTEQTRDLSRFEVAVASAKLVTLEVIEECEAPASIILLNSPEEILRAIVRSQATSAAVKGVATRVLDQRKEVADRQNEIALLEKLLTTVTEDQARLRANIQQVPRTSDAYKRYLAKFDTQETRIEKLQAEIEARRSAIEERTRTLGNYLEEINAE